MRAFRFLPLQRLAVGFGLLLLGTQSFDFVHAAKVGINRKIAYDSAGWADLLDLTRDALTRKPVRKFLRELFKEELREIAAAAVAADPTVVIPRTFDVSETQFLMLLQETPDLVPAIKDYLSTMPRDAAEDAEETERDKEVRKQWRTRFKDLVAQSKIREKFIKLGNPIAPLVMNDDLVAGYSDLKIYSNHAWKNGTKEMPAQNIKQVWIDMILRAKNELALNVYDFDLMDVADAIISRAKGRKKLKKILIGIDAGVVENRPEVKAVFDKIKAAFAGTKHEIHAVDSVGLNHQKLLTIDWTSVADAEVLMSTGNLTQSCSGPEGDAILANPRPKESIPNANHVITLRSQMAALVIYHELSKTIEKPYQLRGGDYPLGGTYRIYGKPYTRDERKGKEYSKPYLQLSFSPNGAFNNVNNNVIGAALRETTGPVVMGQFAISSKDVEEGLYQHAKAVIDSGGKFDFKSVGDTPFAMQFWSVFLRIAGYELVGEGEEKRYVELENNRWRDLLGKKAYEELRAQIKIAPSIYGTRSIKVDNQSFEVTSKIHIKEMVTGEKGSRIAITGSFNFSDGAESNQEYIASFRDATVADALTGMILSLHAASPRSVAKEAVRRNERREYDAKVETKDVEKPKKKKAGSCDHQLAQASGEAA